MAGAPSPFASSKETTNYARLCRLLVDLGSQALRDTFDKVHPPSTLHGKLLSHKPTLQPLYTGFIGKRKVKKVLNPTQWGKLYPVHSLVTSVSFDITLLTVLLRNICGFSPPATGWDNLPPSTDTSTADDIARVKYYRNTVYGHANQASVDDASFGAYWHAIREALVRLGGTSFRGYIDNLEHDTMDPDMEEHYRELMKQWKKDDDSIKEKLEEMEENIRERLHQMKSEMKNNIQSEMKDIKERLDTLTASLEENKNEENIRDRLQQMNSEMKNNIRSEMKEMKERLDTLTASLQENKNEERYRDDLDKMRSEICDKLDALTVSLREAQDEDANVSQTSGDTTACAEINLSGDTEDRGNNLPAVSSYTTALKESIKSQTEFLPKLMDSTAIPNVRIDEIFSNVLIQLDRKTLKKKDERLTRSDQLRCCGQVSGPPVEHCEEIFIAAANDKPRPERILVTGKAGIGKTLLCQKFLRDWADDKLFQSQASKIPNFKFAYLLTFRQLNGLESCQLSLQQLLNRSTLLDDSSNIDDSLFEYIVNHSEEVFIIIDGYDEYSQQDCIAGTSDQQYPNGAKDRMPVAVLCTKLIKRRLLRNSVVMITSRPDESDKMGGIPFDRYMEIAGFSPQQVQEFIKNYFRENDIMKNIVLHHVMKNENLVSFAHIPFMCFLMCFYMEHALKTSNSTNDLPVSTTDIYSEVVNFFQLKHNAASEYRTKQIPERFNASHQVERTLDKLSEFAAELLLQKKPVFEERDMEEKFLPEEIEKLKGSGLLHCSPPFMKSISEIAKYFSFTHLTIQEYLAARWFERGIRDEIPADVSDLVMQFMAGILSKNKSGELLMKKLLEGISSSSSSDHLLLRAKCLSEYRDKEFAKKVIKNHPHHYSENGEFLSINDVDCIAISFLLDVFSALNEEEATTAQHQRPEQSFTFNSLTIINSCLTLSGIKRICESLERECCPVTKLSFYSVPLTDECVDCISRLVCSKLTKLCMMSSGISDTGVTSLCDALKDPSCKVTTLNLTGNQVTVRGVTSLCNFLRCSSCKVTTVGLTTSPSGRAHNKCIDISLSRLCDALKDPSCKVTTLDLCYSEFRVTSFALLCDALKQSSCEVTTLDLSHCRIDATGVTSLCGALQHPGCKVTTLDLSLTPLISETSVFSLCNALKQSSCKLTKLDLTHCKITDSGVSSLCNALQHPSCKVTILNLSGNQITDTGVTSLCEAVQRNNWKLVTLDLGGNRGISEGSKQSLRYVVKQHRPDFDLLM